MDCSQDQTSPAAQDKTPSFSSRRGHGLHLQQQVESKQLRNRPPTPYPMHCTFPSNIILGAPRETKLRRLARNIPTILQRIQERRQRKPPAHPHITRRRQNRMGRAKDKFYDRTSEPHGYIPTTDDDQKGLLEAMSDLVVSEDAEENQADITMC